MIITPDTITFNYAVLSFLLVVFGLAMLMVGSRWLK